MDNEAVNKVEKAISLQNFFPKVRGGITVGVRRIAFAAFNTSTIRSLIKGHEVCSSTLQRGSHVCFIKIDRKIDKETMIESKAEFLGIAVILKLVDRVIHVLPLVLVFEFERNNRNTIDGKHHIDGIVVLCGIGKLACYTQDVILVLLHQILVEL